RKAIDRGREMEAGWQARFDAYAAAFPEDAARLKRELAGELPQGWDAAIPAFAPSEPAIATRAASGRVINELAKVLPNLIGGSADLAPSTNTLIKGADSFSASTPAGRNLHFGVREHAMGAAVNGMALHGGVLPYGATFFVFTDYMRAAIRM